MSDDEDLFDVFSAETDNAAPQPPAPPPGAPVAVPPTASAVSTDTALAHSPGPNVAAIIAAGSGGGGLSIIQNTPSRGSDSAADGGGGEGEGRHGSALAAPADPLKVHVERSSGIRVRRVTKSFGQLPVRLAEYPFLPLSVASGALKAQQQQRVGCGTAAAAAMSALPKTCVGVVIRKTDPKQSASATSTRGGGRAYAVCTLWDMRGVSPSTAASDEEQLAILLCGAAFDLLFTHLCIGSVVAVSNLQALPPKRGDGGEKSSLLVKVANADDIRLLGFAADLGTCESVAKNSNEPCRSLVNTQRGKHCAFHLSAALRQGTSSSSSSRGSKVVASSGPNGRVVAGPRGVATSMHLGGSAAVAVVPGGPLTRVNASASASSALPASPAATRAVALATSRVQTQRLLHQQSFLAVRGGTGLPVSGSGPHGSTNTTSVAQTVYGTVQHGPLAKSRPTDVQLPARYPTTQELGVSARGREVLEATRRLEIQKEHQRLLRQALHTAANRKAKAPLAAMDAPCTAASGSSGGSGGDGGGLRASSARKREREAERVEVEEALRRRRRVAPPTSLAIATRSDGSHGASTSRETAVGKAPSTRSLVDDLKRQFAPLHRGGLDEGFVPVATQGHAAAAVITASASTTGGPLKGSGTAQSAVVAAVTNALRRNDEPLKRQEAQALAAVAAAGTREVSAKGNVDRGILLGAMANLVRSSNDVLIKEAELNRVRDFLDGQAAKEAALHALEQCHEQPVKATYCYACREWYSRLPAKCTAQRHRVERKDTVRRFYACELCGCKMAFLGEETKPWKLMPRCPRCSKEITWEKSSAAPEAAKAAPPLPSERAE